MIQHKKGLISINILRGIAALGVFSYHQGIFHLMANFTKIKAFDYLNTFGAIYAVPLFFLISGYCIHLSHLKQIQLHQFLSLKTYYKRRFWRIYPAYFITLIVSIIVSKVTRYGVMPSQQDFFIHLFCLQGFTIKYFNTINLVLWTISIEVVLYILYPFFYYLRLNFSLNFTLFISFIISSFSILYFVLLKEVSIVQHYLVLNMWFSWCAGAYIADKLFTEPDAFKKPIFKIVYGSIVFLFIYLEILNLSYLSILLYQTKILIWSGPVVCLISKENWLNAHNHFLIRVTGYIGLSSYSLYLLHEPFIALKNFLIHTYLPDVLQKPAMLISIIVVPYISWLSFRFIERPFIDKKRIISNSITVSYMDDHQQIKGSSD